MIDETHGVLPKGYRHIEPDYSGGAWHALPKDQNLESEKINIIRKGWTEIEKEQVRILQDGKCQKCGRPPPRWEYHHKDGNRSNDSISNCEGLCPNCHSVKTHD